MMQQLCGSNLRSEVGQKRAAPLQNAFRRQTSLEWWLGFEDKEGTTIFLFLFSALSFLSSLAKIAMVFVQNHRRRKLSSGKWEKTSRPIFPSTIFTLDFDEILNTPDDTLHPFHEEGNSLFLQWQLANWFSQHWVPPKTGKPSKANFSDVWNILLARLSSLYEGTKTKAKRPLFYRSALSLAQRRTKRAVFYTARLGKKRTEQPRTETIARSYAWSLTGSLALSRINFRSWRALRKVARDNWKQWLWGTNHSSFSFKWLFCKISLLIAKKSRDISFAFFLFAVWQRKLCAM